MRQGDGGEVWRVGGTECCPSALFTYLLLQVSGSVGERNATAWWVFKLFHTVASGAWLQCVYVLPLRLHCPKVAEQFPFNP